jgi:glycosyltransferase involved in cell wall biosynthesis
MKVLIITAVFHPEPIVSAKISEDLAIELSKNHDVIVLCPRPTRPHGFKFPMNNEPVQMYKKITLNSFTSPESNLIKRIRESYSFGKLSFEYIKNNYKYIEVVYMNTWPIFGQYYVMKACVKYRIPYVVHVQDIYPESLSNKIPLIGGLITTIFLPLDIRVLRNANVVIAISEKMKDYLSRTRGVLLSKIKILSNWQDESGYLKLANANANANVTNNTKFTFMYMGNVGPVAGCDLLIKAFSISKIDSSRLVIAGSGSMKDKLIKLTKTLALNNVEFWEVPDGHVPQIQALADVMLLPIKKGAASSSIPSKLPAYMFSKKPIIATVDLESDTARAIKESNCGWILIPEDIKSLSEMMQKVSTLTKEELKTKGEKGFYYALEKYSKKNNMAKAVKYIESINRNEL